MLEVIATTQVVEVPAHAPDHPVNREPVAAAAVRVTEVPLTNDAEHVGPQLMPAGLEVTVPVPPDTELLVTDKV